MTPADPKLRAEAEQVAQTTFSLFAGMYQASNVSVYRHDLGQLTDALVAFAQRHGECAQEQVRLEVEYRDKMRRLSL